jgi:hypothetical protein
VVANKQIDDDPISVRNIGDSAALNINLGVIRIPTQAHGETIVLKTKTIHDLSVGRDERFEHSLEVNMGMTFEAHPVRRFMGKVFTFFKSQSNHKDKNRVRPEIKFSLAYSGVDGRCVTVDCKLVQNFDCDRASIEPAPDWLGVIRKPLDRKRR